MIDLTKSLELVEVALLTKVSKTHVRNLLSVRYNSKEMIEEFCNLLTGWEVSFTNEHTKYKEICEHAIRINDDVNCLARVIDCYWTMAPNPTGGETFLIDEVTNNPISLSVKINKVTYSIDLNEHVVEQLNEIKQLIKNVRQVRPNLLVNKETGDMWVSSINVLIVYAFEEYKEMVRLNDYENTPACDS